jgi:phospholipid/cholesterol/gamma-HCH transport system substrate-binding protein
MFKGNRNLAVGVFISLALAGVAGFSMWLAGTKGNQPLSSYTLLFERDVSGLSLGGPVYYLGVNVGSVSSMSLIPGPQVKVRVDISVLTDTPINSASYASLNAQGITGVTVINIAGASLDPAKPVQIQDLTIPEGMDYPLIPVRQTGLSALLSSAPETMGKINLVLDKASLWLGEQNQQTVTQMLENIESLTSALASEKDQFAALPAELSTLISDAGQAVNQLTKVMGSLEPDVEATLVNVKEASANLAQLTARVDEWLMENEAEFQHFLENGLGQTPDLIFDMRQTLRNLQKLLGKLQEDPSQLIHRSPDNALEVNP